MSCNANIEIYSCVCIYTYIFSVTHLVELMTQAKLSIYGPYNMAPLYVKQKFDKKFLR